MRVYFTKAMLKAIAKDLWPWAVGVPLWFLVGWAALTTQYVP